MRSTPATRTGDPPRNPYSTPIWSRPQRLGYPEMLRTGGGIVAPLLAGFSLATIATIASSASPPRLAVWSIAALAAAVGFLLFSMQTAPLALAHSVSPDQRLSWYPEATVNREALERARWDHEVDRQLVRHYWKLTGSTYDLGLVSFLVGLVLLLVPEDWTVPRTAAVVVAALALLVELRWTIGTWTGLTLKSVVKEPGVPLRPIELSPLDDDDQCAAVVRREDST